MNVLGVIAARGGSKGIPRKNLRVVGGKPLLAYSIEAARTSRWLDRVIVSTEDHAIATVAEQYGAEVPFLRPQALAEDHVSLIPVAQHAMRFFDAQGWRPDVVVSIQPTSPLLTGVDMDLAVRLLVESNGEAVVTVTEILHHHPFRAMKLDGHRLLPLTEYTSERYLQKQDRPPAYGLSGGLYVRRRALLDHWTGCDFAIGHEPRAIVIDPTRAVNIDHEVDLFLFEALLTHHADQGRYPAHDAPEQGASR